jgi:hypothetical protein
MRCPDWRDCGACDHASGLARACSRHEDRAFALGLLIVLALVLFHLRVCRDSTQFIQWDHSSMTLPPPFCQKVHRRQGAESGQIPGLRLQALISCFSVVSSIEQRNCDLSWDPVRPKQT